MTRRKFSREFKIDAVRLVTYEEDQELIRGINSPTNGGVAIAQAARDLAVAASVLRRWMRERTTTLATAFPGNGQMRAGLSEISALKKEVAWLRAERDMPRRKPQLFSRAFEADCAIGSSDLPKEHEVRLHCQTAPHLAGQLAL
ncbi:Transposase [Pseudogemmobacter humi]|uniref:Transposase n=1 Tax=Pseudogemmobacter humi TaxID=2483812 RepID=A0A3P5WV55_9RHOB|nr:Transposase [Pseudogemmobacter humi]